MGSTSIAWQRNDLRMADNEALGAAIAAGQTTVAVYIHETTEGVRAPGAAARWWLHHSLEALGGLVGMVDQPGGQVVAHSVQSFHFSSSCAGRMLS